MYFVEMFLLEFWTLSKKHYSVTIIIIDRGTKVAKFSTFTAILASCQFFPCYGDQNDAA